jgi:hypothetical protein
MTAGGVGGMLAEFYLDELIRIKIVDTRTGGLLNCVL